MVSDSEQHAEHPDDNRLGNEAIWAQKRRLAAAMRRVIELLVTTDAPAGELRAATERVERFAERLAKLPQRRIVRAASDGPALSTPEVFYHLSPLVGLSNPVAPPIRLWTEGSEIRGEMVFGTAYQGPPGYLHGGLVAALFDEALAHVQYTTGRPGMTGTLKVRYHRPTPLHTTLRLEATVQRVHGRKTFTEARLYAGDVLTADAEGLFISLDFEALAENGAGGNPFMAR